MTRDAPLIGWGALGGAAVAASFGSLFVQLVAAALAIGLLGMAHGASDLAVVDRSRRPVFVVAYLAISAICLAWWTTVPAMALPLFLVASAIHFGLEDAPAGSPVEQVARGASLVTTPAVLHGHALAMLLGLAGGRSEWLTRSVPALAIVGGVTAAGLLALAWRRRDARLAAGTVALLVFPPLIGFAVGFLVLHAGPQTAVRRQQIGCASNLAYLRAVAPILLASFAMVGVIAVVVLRFDPSGVRALFAGIAALATPHLLVTPWFERAVPARSTAVDYGRLAPAGVTRRRAIDAGTCRG